MISWQSRPTAVALLLNPALLAVVIASIARGYEAVKDNGMPWELVFVATPLVMHGPTRRSLPRDTRTHLAAWIIRNPAVRAGFPNRARSLVTPSLEGLRFGLRHHVLALDGAVIKADVSLPAGTGQLAGLIRAAALVGRWLGRLDRPSTAFALFGVTP